MQFPRVQPHKKYMSHRRSCLASNLVLRATFVELLLISEVEFLIIGLENDYQG